MGYKDKIYNLEDTKHDKTNWDEAMKKANEFNYNGIKADTKIPMGIFYAKERPTIEEQYEVLRKKIRK